MKRTTKNLDPFTVDAGDGWKIDRYPETREYGVFVAGELIGYRDTLDEARALRQGYSYDALAHIPAHYDLPADVAVAIELRGAICAMEVA